MRLLPLKFLRKKELTKDLEVLKKELDTLGKKHKICEKMRSLDEILIKREEVQKRFLELDKKGEKDAKFYEGALSFADWLIGLK